MPGGTLPRVDTELLILRVAHNTGCQYEWHHHEQIAPASGLDADQVARAREGPGADGWCDTPAGEAGPQVVIRSNTVSGDFRVFRAA